MDEWETEYIQSNLVSLINEIDASPILPYLVQSRIISKFEKDKLDIIRRIDGRMDQTNQLLDILSGRLNGYQHLVKALSNYQQSGPMITLLYGVQINTLANPFRYCGVQIKLEDFQAIKINFGGHKMPLRDIHKNFTELQAIALKEIVDVSIYKHLIGEDEITVAKETIPAVTPYYIKRTLTLKNKLDTNLFKDRQQDYFLIEKIEPNELTRLAQMSQINESTRPRTSNIFSRHQNDNTIFTSVSSEQLHELTSRFILLENEQHFDHICSRWKGKNFHFIKFTDNDYFLERSSRPKDVKKYILDDQVYISEEGFFELTTNPYPVIIFDTPGMGKSAVLTNLASQLKRSKPTDYVVYFEMQELVRRLLTNSCQIDISSIEQEILDTISTNKFGKFINQELFNEPSRLVYLFLDAFDEVNPDNHDVAKHVVKILNENKSFKIFITSRPHQGGILETSFGVIGYGILPFQFQEQVDFLVEYWKKLYGADSSVELVQFARNLLIEFREKLSPRDREITGIPLQCKMLADVYADKITMKLYSLKSAKVSMNTIYDMYREYFYKKFPHTLLQPGKSKLLDMHFKLALDLLFPEFAKNFTFWQAYRCDSEIFSIGILEISKSGNEQFVHRTFAEFLVAELTCNFLYINQLEPKIPMSVCLDFCFSKVLEVIEFEIPSRFPQDRYMNSDGTYKFSPFKFKYPVLAFFLGHWISFHVQENQVSLFNDFLGNGICTPSPKKCRNILFASIESNSVGLYKWTSYLFRDIFNNDLKKYITPNSTVTFTELSLILVSQFGNVDLLKLHCDFVANLLEEPVDFNPMLSLEYMPREDNFFSHPIYYSVERGDYYSFEFMFHSFETSKLYVSGNKAIISHCLNGSNKNNSLVITGKLQILKFLVSTSSANYVNVEEMSLFSLKHVHIEILLVLLDQGINVVERDSEGSTIAHKMISYLSRDDYHKLVEWLAENRFFEIFRVKNSHRETAVRWALTNLELKNETAQILANKCNINFNERNDSGETELVSAIKAGRGESLLKTLVELGADIKTKDKHGCNVLCHSVKSKNIKALKCFLSLGLNPNVRCGTFFSNIWDHLLESNKEKFNVSDIAILLIEYGADTNSATVEGKGKVSWSLFEPASIRLKRQNLKSECVSILDEKPTVGCISTSCMLNCCCWTFCCCLLFGSYCEDHELFCCSKIPDINDGVVYV